MVLLPSKNERLEVLKKEVFISEAYLCGIFWSNPSLYDLYSSEKLSKEIFLNKPWAFYFQLGRVMAEKKVTVFDDITYYKHVAELKVESMSDEFGGYNTISEITQEVKGKEDNLEAYYEEVKKYRTIVSLSELFGNKVTEINGKYDYHDLNRERIHAYWADRVNKAGMQGDSKFEIVYLLDGLEDMIQELDKNPDTGLPFHGSPRMTEITNGWATSNVYILGSFFGRG